jgi:pimeloyl-ACP methyl ester carboxylesterase
MRLAPTASWIGLMTALLTICGAPTRVSGVPVVATFSYDSTVSTDGSGALDLVAELNYDSSRSQAPIAVVMHPYSGNNGLIASVRGRAQRLRDKGFFVISVAMRGRDGSDGIRDSGGLEIYDIYDAVEAVKARSQFSSLIDPTNVHITGYSGGGGNTMSALTKFPDYFRAGGAFFGMSDYGFDPVNGWYNNGAGGRTSQLDIDVGGNPNTDGPSVVDRYHARASNLASKNNPYSQIHLFVNEDETISPKINVTSYRDNAVAAAEFAGEFDNIVAHIGMPGTYFDFDNSGTFEADEEQDWPHQMPTANQQDAAEQWYVPGLLDGSIPEPVLNMSDSLFVAGFVKTQPFEVWLGDGQNAVGELNYTISANIMTFDLEILSNDLSKTGRLTIDASATNGAFVNVKLNGEMHERTVTAGDDYIYEGLTHNDTIQVELLPKGDLNFDGSIDGTDHAMFALGMHADLSALSVVEAYAKGDLNGDQVNNAQDFLLFQDIYDDVHGPGAFAALRARVIPEPTTSQLIFCATGLILLMNWDSLIDAVQH